MIGKRSAPSKATPSASPPRSHSASTSPARHTKCCDELLLWLFDRRRGLRRWWRGGFRGGRLADRQILAHLLETLGPQAANRQQIVDALECAIRFPHPHNFLRRRRPDPRDELQFFGRRGVDVYRLRRRFFLSTRNCPPTEPPSRKNEKHEPRL